MAVTWKHLTSLGLCSVIAWLPPPIVICSRINLVISAPSYILVNNSGMLRLVKPRSADTLGNPVHVKHAISALFWIWSKYPRIINAE